MSSKNNPWYFGDYSGGFPGVNYNKIIYLVTILLFMNISISTEESVVASSNDISSILDYFLKLVQVFFVTDYIGKIANSWSNKDYQIPALINSLINIRSLFDLVSLFALILPILPKESPILLAIYIIKMGFTIYQSELREIINRLKFIIFHNPTKTFFPMILLSVLSYLFATLIYLAERTNDPEHFGSIPRALWFSITMISFAFDSLTPESLLGKIISLIFGLLGLVCIALLTANIIDSNTEYDNQIES